MSEGGPERPRDGRGRPGDGEAFWTSRRWWRRAGHTAAGVWLANGVSILATIVAARALGPSEYGSFLLGLAAVNTVAIFLDVTFEEATNFYGNRALHDGDVGGLRALLRLSLRVDIAIGVVVTALVIALSGVLADLASAGRLDPTLVQISAFSVLVTTADSTAYAALALARRVDLRARALAATSVLRLIGVIIAVQLGGAEAVAISYVLGGALGSIVLARYAWREGWRKWAPEPGTGPDSHPVGTRELVRFGFHSSLMSSVQSISGTLVPVILARAAGTAAVGVYRVARLPITAANTLQAPMRLAMFPEQSRLVAEGRMAEVRRSTKGYTMIAFGLGIVGAAVGYVAMPWLIPFLYSSSFEAAVTPARIMLIAAVFNLAFLWRKTLLAALGRPEIRTRLVAVEVVVILSVLLVLADRGAEGAAIAASAGAVAAGLTWAMVARGLLADRPGPSTPRKRTEANAEPPEATASRERRGDPLIGTVADRRRCTVFLHIPKTGGVTLRGAFRQKYPGRVITLHSPREPERVGDLPLAERRAARVLTGHLPYGVDRYMPQECDYVTVLREPVARVVSTYHHVLDHPQHWFHDEAVGNDMSLEEFVEATSGPADNLQTRLLAGRMEGQLVTRANGSVAVTPLGTQALEEARANLDRFLVVGLTERFDESFILVRRALGWRLPMYATRNAARGSRRPLPSNRAAELIAQRDRLDMALYGHAQQMLEATIEREGASFAREVAAFRMLNRIPNALGPRVPAALRNPVWSLRRRALARQEPPGAGR